MGCDHMMVTSIKRGHLRAEPVADGVCRLGPDAIEVLQGEEVVWSLPYTDMKAVLLQFRNALQVRVEGVNFQLDPVGQSTLRWHHHLAMRCGGMVG